MTPEDIAEIERHEAEVAETMRHLEEEADAAKRGWAKAAAEVVRLTVELESLRVDYRKAAADLSRLRGIAAECDHHRATAESLTSRQHRQRAEIQRLRAERNESRAAIGFVRALADEWEQVIAENAFGKEWLACLRANLPALRDALDGGRT